MFVSRGSCRYIYKLLSFLLALTYEVGMWSCLSRGCERQHALYSRQVHCDGELEGIIDAQHLFASANNETRSKPLELALRASLGLAHPLSAQGFRASHTSDALPDVIVLENRVSSFIASVL